LDAGFVVLNAIPKLKSLGIPIAPASLSMVPETGSTAALLEAGVVALAFARRKLG